MIKLTFQPGHLHLQYYLFLVKDFIYPIIQACCIVQQLRVQSNHSEVQIVNFRRWSDGPNVDFCPKLRLLIVKLNVFL